VFDVLPVLLTFLVVGIMCSFGFGFSGAVSGVKNGRGGGLVHAEYPIEKYYNNIQHYDLIIQ
jgi:hypothetical protein